MKKLSKIFILCLVLVVSLSTIVFAEDTFSLNVSTDKTTLNPGETITLNIVLGNLNVESGEKGIGAVQGSLSYDSNVFEIKSVSSNGWEVSQNEGNIIANTADGEVVKETTTIATITLKVLDNATLGDTTLKFEEVIGSTGVTTIDGTSTAKTLKIAKAGETPAAQQPSNPQPGISENTNTVAGTGSNKVVTNSSTTAKNTTATNSSSKLPYTGLNQIVLITIPILLIVAIVSYYRYKKYSGIQ